MHSAPKIGIVVGRHGRGSNMAALIEACQSDRVPAVVHTVISPDPRAPAADKARALGVAVRPIPAQGDIEAEMLWALRDVDFVCLAGFLRLVPTTVLDRFPDRVLNIHPSLLPKFGGRGMYGLKVHEAVLAAHEPESGCTVHLVNERYDEGQIVLQKRCPVEEGDTPETLAARVLALEHRAYPEALAKVIGE